MNKLLNAWEGRYGENRSKGRALLQDLCRARAHLLPSDTEVSSSVSSLPVGSGKAAKVTIVTLRLFEETQLGVPCEDIDKGFPLVRISRIDACCSTSQGRRVAAVVEKKR